jgi:hypothetical protein
VSGIPSSTLIQAVRQAYGSLEEPNYSFVQSALATNPYRELIQRLAQHFTIEETTDVNDDVSFRYVLRHPPATWSLDLSMVGPFGLLMRLSETNEHAVVTGETELVGRRERSLAASLATAGIQLLPRSALEERIDLRRPLEDGEETLLYHALISDEPLLPWHSDD